MIERFFFHRIDCGRNRAAVICSHQYAALIAPGKADSVFAVGNSAMVRAEIAEYPLVVKFPIIAGFVHTGKIVDYGVRSRPAIEGQ